MKRAQHKPTELPEMEALAVPAGFPYGRPGGALPGIQLKFSVSRNEDGRLAEPGSFYAQRVADYALCLELTRWGRQLLLEKSAQAKYRATPPTTMLAKLKINLESDLGLPPAYSMWILSAIARELEWAPKTTSLNHDAQGNES